MFCAAEADARGDSMVGTAPPQARILLIHQPGPWGPRGLLESRCDPETASRLDHAAARAGMRLQTIRRPGEHARGTPSGGYFVGIADVRPGAKRITWWRTRDLGAFVSELEAGTPALPPATVETAPQFLVCTHGKHDPCCALRGRPVAEALERVRPGRVWETTHTGGDRFAANVLVLPSGALYGRVSETMAAELADAADAGRLLPAHLRGRIGLAPPAQAALVYACEQLSIDDEDAVGVTAVERTTPDEAHVHLTTPRGPVTVTVAARTRPPAQLTCRGPLPAKAREFRGVALR